MAIRIVSSMRVADTDSNIDLIVTGRICRSDGSWGYGEIWISGEKIVAIHGSRPPTPTPSTARRIDAGDDFVLPGAVDAHVHSLSHDGEGIRAATRAALAGGVTTIVEMPFDGAGPINNRDKLLTKQELVHDEAHVDVALLGTLAPDGGWRKADVLVDNGVVGFKVSLFMTDEVRFPRINDFELLNVMKAVTGTGTTLCTHAENNEIVKSLLTVEEAKDPFDPQSHSRSRPPVSETLGVLTALEVAAYQGTALHICHLSLPRSIDLVGWYQGQGVDVTLETCPHYLTFTEADLDLHRGHLKINPPLRTAADREGVWNRVDAGRVNVISSDHAPWPRQLKEHHRILDNHSGVPGVETLVAATLGAAIRRDPALKVFTTAVNALTIGPAQRFGLDREKGSIEVGKDADLMIFSPGSDTAVDGSSLNSNAGWSPYDGMKLGGRVTATVLRGQLAWSTSGGFANENNRGQLVGRSRG